MSPNDEDDMISIEESGGNLEFSQFRPDSQRTTDRISPRNENGYENIREYKTILDSVQSSHTAEYNKNHTKCNALRKKCSELENQLSEMQSMNYTLQSQFARAERDLANSLLEKAQIKIENQCLHNGIKRSQQNLKEITDTLQEIISRNAIKNQEWNWRMKRDLHARRSIEKKLRDATGTRVAKCNRSDQLQSKGLLERNSSNSEMDLSVKLKSCEERKEYQGDRNDSASRMKMDRKLTEAKCEIAKLKAKNRQLQRLCEDAQVNGQNYDEIQGMMDAVVNDIEIQNAKHTKVVQQMKKSLKHEISSLILNTIQNSTVIQQKLDLIDSLAFENSQITSKLEELQDSILKLAQTLCQVDTMHETQLKQPNVCAVDEKNCIARTVNYLNVLEHNAILRKQNLLFQDIIYSALGHIPAICDLMTFILENTNISGSRNQFDAKLATLMKRMKYELGKRNLRKTKKVIIQQSC